jgi:hypothetical protein
VSWLASRPGNAPAPDTAKLGPKYQLVVFVDNAPDQAFDLYPLAVGGPRVFRPADQPKKKTVAAWLYGRVSMPDTLRDAGVPLIPPSGNQPGSTGDGTAGGQGGGAGEVDVGGVGSPPSGSSGFDGVFEVWQRGILLIGGGAVVLLLLLGGVSLLVRKGP